MALSIPRPTDRVRRLRCGRARVDHRGRRRSESGVAEAGIDGGGLFKEFLLLAVQAAFGAEYALVCLLVFLRCRRRR